MKGFPDLDLSNIDAESLNFTTNRDMNNDLELNLDGNQMALGDIDKFLEDELNELEEDQFNNTDDPGRHTAREDLIKQQLLEK